MSYWTLWMTIQFDLQFSLILYITIQSRTWWFHFFCFPYIENKNVKRGRGKGGRQQLRNSSHKGKHKIELYPKYILIFTAYQVQWLWNIIISTVKDRLDCRHVRENLLKSSQHTHLNHSKPYTFIFQKLKKPPD